METPNEQEKDLEPFPSTGFGAFVLILGFIVFITWIAGVWE